MTTYFKTFILTAFVGMNLFACATLNSSNNDAMSYVTPILSDKTCPGGKGVYKQLKNRHETRTILVTVETDVDPDPNNWYPANRPFRLQPNQERILGCTEVSSSDASRSDMVSFAVKEAQFE